MTSFQAYIQHYVFMKNTQTSKLTIRQLISIISNHLIYDGDFG